MDQIERVKPVGVSGTSTGVLCSDHTPSISSEYVHASRQVGSISTETGTQSQDNEEDQFWKLIAALKNPLIVTVGFLFTILTSFVVVMLQPDRDDIIDGINSWGDCVLRNYVGSGSGNENGSWIPECGEHPELRTNVHMRHMTFGILQAQGVVVVAVYMPKVVSFYQKLFEILTNTLSTVFRV